MTMTEAARRLGISTSMLSLILGGSRRPSTAKAKSLEEQSGIPRMTWLYDSPADILAALESRYGKMNFEVKS